MRPIVMDMQGFASFREQTRVDFTDTDFFALVGPTGAGKSTVIDAMTFALYGSVPRWGRKNMISLALAPTVTRATVKLVFEVGRQRYVIARELRRMGSQVSQRAASLERIIDPGGLAEKGDNTAPMAKDLAGVNDAVERLLGLSYEDFIQCVVLPQGKFADFLHAKPSERQDILLRLLGAEHFRQMMMKANQLASAAEQRVETLGESLLSYADATEDAEKRSRAAQVTLAALADRVTQALPRIRERQADLFTAEERLRRLQAEHAVLSGLHVPADIAELHSSLMAGQAELARLQKGEQDAEAADTDARRAVAAGPQRAPLELARERRRERKQRQDKILALEIQASQLAARVEITSAAVQASSAELEALRDRRDMAAQEATVVGDLATRLEREHTLLGGVSVPDDVAALDVRLQAAAAAEAAAARALAEAEEADVAARAARDAAVPEIPLAQAYRDLNDLRDLLTDLETARHAAKHARAAQVSAENELRLATQALGNLREALKETERAHIVAGLRPHLVAGEPCPLCEQAVTTLPEVMTAPEVDDARSRLGEAERAERAAQGIAKKADLSVVETEGDLKSRLERHRSLVVSLASLLDGPLASAPLPATRSVQTRSTFDTDGMVVEASQVHRAFDEVGALVQERAELELAARSAAKETDAARALQRAAHLAEQEAHHDVSAAKDALRTARDPLVQLGAPQVDAASLADAWTMLDAWAEKQKQARAGELRAARERSRMAVARYEESAAEFTEGERVLARLRADENSAVLDDQQVRTQLSETAERVTELEQLLRDAPDDEQLAEQLALADRLETAVTAAAKSLQAARSARAKGETALADLTRTEESARARLSSARDSVVALGAPALDGRGLLDAWNELAVWSTSQAASREQQAGAVSADVSTARSLVGQLSAELSATLAESAIELDPDSVVTGAAPAVAQARERARAATERIVERRSEAADLRSRQQAAQEEQQVAKLLGDLLRANNFQRWLVNATVDDLVTEASATLSALSSGQFDLTYDDGDFYVIDHTDADARRSVRTLSGGETFQASLALALALSSQISALAAAGAARLDSIFLDEGFGTLDPETLEVVATTLETLAQGDRMVGVVTHVSALAERVPVRFRVARNARTSTITREGFTAAEGAEEEAMA